MQKHKSLQAAQRKSKGGPFCKMEMGKGVCGQKKRIPAACAGVSIPCGERRREDYSTGVQLRRHGRMAAVGK